MSIEALFGKNRLPVFEYTLLLRSKVCAAIPDKCDTSIVIHNNVWR